MVGYGRVNDRFGKWVENKWEPGFSNVTVHRTKKDFAKSVSRAFKPHGDLGTGSRRIAKSRLSEIEFLYSGGLLHANDPVLENPLCTAFGSAKMIVRVWGDGYTPQFRMQAEGEVLPPNPLSDLMNKIVQRAHGALVEYLAFEALGLLRPPLSRLESYGLVEGAVAAIFTKQFALALGPKINEVIFRVTQGRYTKEEIEALNEKMGPTPKSLDLGNKLDFFLFGFLKPLGDYYLSYDLTGRDLLEMEKRRSRAITTNLVWTAQRLMPESPLLLPQYWQRPDIAELLRNREEEKH